MKVKFKKWLLTLFFNFSKTFQIKCNDFRLGFLNLDIVGIDQTSCKFG